MWALIAVCFILFLHGAVPFIATPTLGQAIWSTGFAQSFSNGSIVDLYAHDFGIPKPAAIAFGLAAAWPMSLLIRLGLHPADAYSSVFALWLCVAFYGAFAISRYVGTRRVASLVAGVAWLGMPIVLNHAVYSMLSLGIALLPFYFLAVFSLFPLPGKRLHTTQVAGLFYLGATVIAVFMDGYTFVMFAMGSSILLIYTGVQRTDQRNHLFKVIFPVHVASFTCAYMLYRAYIGRSDYPSHSTDFFRGWGLDLIFLLVPTRDVSWLADWAGISKVRSDILYFGDWSVWTTTFSIPIIAIGAAAWLLTRKRNALASALLLVAVFGFYMSLGPSVKFNSVKPESLQASQPGQQSALMPAELAIMPTGNAWISENIPGFNAMRASYRWLALCIFAFWLLVVMNIAITDGKQRLFWMSMLIAVTGFNVPDLNKKWLNYAEARETFDRIDNELLSELMVHVKRGERIAFIPWGNDFLANYLSARGGFNAYNIGGDKNVQNATLHWPSALQELIAPLTLEKLVPVTKLLVDGNVNSIIVPYFDLLESAHEWPCATYIASRKESMQGFINGLKALDYLTVTETYLFVVVRLKSSDAEDRLALKARLLGEARYPLTLNNELQNSGFILADGWYALETQHVWSNAKARLDLPVPSVCESRSCSYVLKFMVYGASAQRAVNIDLRTTSSVTPWNSQMVITTNEDYAAEVPLTSNVKHQEITISATNAISPLALTGSPDGRTLGIGLKTIELRIQ